MKLSIDLVMTWLEEKERSACRGVITKSVLPNKQVDARQHEYLKAR